MYHRKVEVFDGVMFADFSKFSRGAREDYVNTQSTITLVLMY